MSAPSKPNSLASLPVSRLTRSGVSNAAAGSATSPAAPQVVRTGSPVRGDSKDPAGAGGGQSAASPSKSSLPPGASGGSAGGGGGISIGELEALIRRVMTVQIEEIVSAKVREATKTTGVEAALTSMPKAGSGGASGGGQGLDPAGVRGSDGSLLSQLGTNAAGGDPEAPPARQPVGYIRAGPRGRASDDSSAAGAHDASRSIMTTHDARPIMTTHDTSRPIMTTRDGSGVFASAGSGGATGITPRDMAEFMAWQRATESKRKDLFSLDQLFARRDDAGSFEKWVRAYQYETPRNKYESISIAAAVDALLDEGVPRTSRGIEILLRRLVGVQVADKNGGNWAAAEVISGVRNDSLIDRQTETEILKSASNAVRFGKKQSGGGAKDKGNHNNKNDKKPPSGGKT